MNYNTAWENIRYWAEVLDEKYPRTDLLSLSDDELKKMLLSFVHTAELPTEKTYFFALKSAWAVVQNGGDDSGEVPDAYI